ncbi:MAG: tripartite tricarboxylate transporter TctB family protein [Motiliproteus sp.]
MINRDLLTGIGIIALSLLGLLVVIPAGVVVSDSDDNIALSPAFWPNVIMITMLLAGISVLLKVLLDKLRRLPAVIRDEDESLLRTEDWRLVLVIPALFAYYYLINELGIQLSSGLLLVVMMLLGGERRFWLLLSIAIILPTFLNYFFIHIANVNLPLGWFD